MRRLNLLIALLGALVVALGGLMSAAPALAYNISAVYKDCETNGALTGHYPRAELQSALNSLPAQVSEYSACADIIRTALLRASSHSGGSHNVSSNALAAGGRGGRGGGSGRGGQGSHRVRADRAGTSTRKGRRTAATGSGAVPLADSSIRPGSTETGGGSSSLPAALVVVLILLALTAVSGGAVAIRRRVVARHGT